MTQRIYSRLTMMARSRPRTVDGYTKSGSRRWRSWAESSQRHLVNLQRLEVLLSSLCDYDEAMNTKALEFEGKAD